MLEVPKFIQGIFPFQGKGLDQPEKLPSTTYKVPFDKRSQLVYVRFGNSSSGLLVITILRNGERMRYVPVGAKASLHVTLAVTEDIAPESIVELGVAAEEGTSGMVVVDVGFVEI